MGISQTFHDRRSKALRTLFASHSNILLAGGFNNTAISTFRSLLGVHTMERILYLLVPVAKRYNEPFQRTDQIKRDAYKEDG